MRVDDRARLVGLAVVLCALAGVSTASTDGRILFPGHPAVPRPVQDFAWRVIETHCNYQSREREERSFWAYDTRVTKGDGAVVYSIKILSELSWRKREPPAMIEMMLVDDGTVRLTALTSSYVVCTP